MSTWNPNAASLVVDLRHLRCGQCKVRVDDRFAERCPTCGAVFDRVVSGHAGLAQRLVQERRSHFDAKKKPDSQPAAIAPVAGSRQRDLVTV